ncbi:hypothetical protein UFOVP579_54 [uncultured Caudovirales phage]|uniref:Uncharacterized protein n=1 Tax=uncultured Caudovirales phage TaxID=2100421 RepID=A0A6J5LT41_9CAUD|nr:hypothetical protein UFOVP302_54 [uncultured Caudovirales phage]CAB4168771.1 hypothetical protein UFOVP579_54 [uncultured Caudovirales phage]
MYIQLSVDYQFIVIIIHKIQDFFCMQKVHLVLKQLVGCITLVTKQHQADFFQYQQIILITN